MKVLLVEPDRLQADVYIKVLSPYSQVSWVRTAQAAISKLDEQRHDLVLAETNLDHHNGVELLHEVRSYEDWRSIPFYFLSAMPKERFPLKNHQWRQYGVDGYFNKASTRPEQLLDLIEPKINAAL